jgi:uncharacterized repeat protein (TIGR01451 family)
LAAQTSVTVTIEVTVTANSGTLSNKATAVSPSGSKVSNEVTHTVTAVPVPVLEVSKQAEPVDGSDVEVGDQIVYTILVTNSGGVTATNVLFTDTLDANLTEVSKDTMVTTLGPAMTAQVVITVTVKGGTVITNVASVSADNVAKVDSNVVTHNVVKPNVYLPIILRTVVVNTPTPTATTPNQPTATPTATSVGKPNLQIQSISLSPASPKAGDAVTVKVVVKNVGTAPAKPLTGSAWWVDFYINPATVPTTGGRWDTKSSTLGGTMQGIAWKVEKTLAVGESVTLVSLPAGSTSNGEIGYVNDKNLTIWNGAFVSGTTDLYAYADSFIDPVNALFPTRYLVDESSETDNMLKVTVPGAPLGGTTVEGEAIPPSPLGQR